MKIIRQINRESSKYDITELTHEEFMRLFHCYEVQMYVVHNRQYPEDDELFNKLKKMVNEERIVI
jgi:hypothetical protein